jgi:hypothetical protein
MDIYDLDITGMSKDEEEKLIKGVLEEMTWVNLEKTTAKAVRQINSKRSGGSAAKRSTGKQMTSERRRRKAKK